MLTGPPGLGKRAAACWLAAEKLGVSRHGLPQYPAERFEHPDLRWVSMPEDKTSILIDQVRALVDGIGLTSYEGHGKVAVIEPADRMTTNAANSLLKTLEEPPGDALLILVADRVGRLPATVFSRCQRIDLHAPDEAQALAWLDRLQPGGRWSDALKAAGGAPLGAIAAAEVMEQTTTMARDFAAVASGRASPLDVALAWSKLDPGFVLEWLARTVAGIAKAAIGGADGGAPIELSDSVRKRMDLRNLFCYLDSINRLRGRPAGSYNVQLTLEGLLIDWATGLASAGPYGAAASFARAGTDRG
jgi:DNA polymerase-3 subunit delta'